MECPGILGGTVCSIPVVAADSHVWQAGVTWDVDAVRIGVELSRTAAAASIEDVASQHRQDTLQWGGVVKHRPRCILGRLRMLEVKGNDLDSELHCPYEKTRETVLKGSTSSKCELRILLMVPPVLPLYFCDSSVSRSSSMLVPL